MAQKRIRRVKSVTHELLYKSREAALSAVQIFNNPQITFKSELFTVTMCIAWTYMMHAFYRKEKIDYKYFEINGRKKVFHRTKHGAYKYWELERCLNDAGNPIDDITSKNLKFLIGLRNEIEHQMTTRIDDTLSARFQACCINYNDYIKKIFGDKFGIDKFLSVSLQFSSISENQVDYLSKLNQLPGNIQKYIFDFDKNISEDEYGNPKFSYRVFFIAKTVNNKGQADKVVEFIKPESEISELINREYRKTREIEKDLSSSEKIVVLRKEVEKAKFLPSHVVKIMQEKGFRKFHTQHHVRMWKELDAKNPTKNFGVQVATTWYWYKNWVDFVEKHCENNRSSYEE